MKTTKKTSSITVECDITPADYARLSAAIQRINVRLTREKLPLVKAQGKGATRVLTGHNAGVSAVLTLTGVIGRDLAGPDAIADALQSTKIRAPKVATVESQSKAGLFYTIRKSGKGRVTCDCPSFRFSHIGRCKHTDVYLGVVEEGIQNPAVTLAA